MKQLYKQIIKFYTNSSIMLLLDDAIFYSARTKSHDVLQIIITQINTDQYIVEQTMMKGYKKQSSKTIADADSIVQHICRLQCCVC